MEHYLTTLLRKPGALTGSVALQQVPHLIRELFDRHFVHCPKEFFELLQYAEVNGYCFSDVTDASSRLLHRGLRRLSADQIKAELHSATLPVPLREVSASQDLIPRQSLQIEQLAAEAISSTDTLLKSPTN